MTTVPALNEEGVTPTVTDSILFNQGERPYWQTRPCPSWCVATHYDSDDPDDRHHHGIYLGVPLAEERPHQAGPYLQEPAFRFRAPIFSGSLLQSVREVEPLIELLDDRDVYHAKVRLDEATDFAHVLFKLVAYGRDTTTEISSPGGVAEHQPWCQRQEEEHDDDVCSAEEIEIQAGFVGLTYNPDEGGRIHFERCADTHGGMTPDEAEELAFTLLAQARRGRESAAS